MPAPRACLIPLLLTPVSCGRSAVEGGFDAPVPAAKLRAVQGAARRGDPSAAKDLVEQLDSDDPAVRFAAIEALRTLTGEDHGYDYRDDPPARRRAIEAWVRSMPADAAGDPAVSPGPDAEIVHE